MNETPAVKAASQAGGDINTKEPDWLLSRLKVRGGDNLVVTG